MTNHQHQHPDLIKPTTLAKLLGISPQVIYTYMRTNRLPYTQHPITNCKMLTQATVQAELQRRQQKQALRKQKITNELNQA